MTRSNAREIAVHLLFAMDYTGQTPQELVGEWFDKEYYSSLETETAVYAERPNQKQLNYIKAVLTGVTERREELDGYIAEYAVGWNLSRISRLAKCIMRVAMYESLYIDDVPTGVAINEAVELAKKYEEESTIPFINGILGSFSRRDTQKAAAEAEEAEPAPQEQE
jgi:N utilization substance protein B